MPRDPVFVRSRRPHKNRKGGRCEQEGSISKRVRLWQGSSSLRSLDRGSGDRNSGAAGSRGRQPSTPSALVSQLALARLATAKYVTNLGAREGERLRDHHEDDPEHGLPLHEPEGRRGSTCRSRRSSCTSITARAGSSARSSGSSPSKPATPPLPGAKYGSFGAGCHYKDGTFVPAAGAGRVPDDGARRRARRSTSGIRC